MPLPGSIERRAFVRIRLEADVRYAKAENPAAAAKPAEWRPALLRDISGGGAKLTTSERLEVKDKVILEVPIDNQLLQLRGTVQRAQLVRSGTSSQFDLGIEFVDVKQSDRDRIVGLVFRLQLNIHSQKPSVVV